MEVLEIIALTVVKERIAHYKQMIESQDSEKPRPVASSLLLFWINYKNDHYPNS